MATGSAAMTGLSYHATGREDYSSLIVLSVESHNWMLFFFFHKDHEKSGGKQALDGDLNSLC